MEISTIVVLVVIAALFFYVIGIYCVRADRGAAEASL